MVYHQKHIPEDTVRQTSVWVWFHHIYVYILWLGSGYLVVQKCWIEWYLAYHSKKAANSSIILITMLTTKFFKVRARLLYHLASDRHECESAPLY
jgi:hypothetical protein